MRNYKRKAEDQYDQETFCLAVNAFKTKNLSLQATSIKYCVPTILDQQRPLIVAVISGPGTFNPPMILFLRKIMNPQLLGGSFPGTVGLANTMGLVDSEYFL